MRQRIRKYDDVYIPFLNHIKKDELYSKKLSRDTVNFICGASVNRVDTLWGAETRCLKCDCTLTIDHLQNC